MMGYIVVCVYTLFILAYPAQCVCPFEGSVIRDAQGFATTLWACAIVDMGASEFQLVHSNLFVYYQRMRGVKQSYAMARHLISHSWSCFCCTCPNISEGTLECFLGGQLQMDRHCLRGGQDPQADRPLDQRGPFLPRGGRRMRGLCAGGGRLCTPARWSISTILPRLQPISCPTQPTTDWPVLTSQSCHTTHHSTHDQSPTHPPHISHTPPHIMLSLVLIQKGSWWLPPTGDRISSGSICTAQCRMPGGR